MGKVFRTPNDITGTVPLTIPRTILNWDDELHTPIEDFQLNLAQEIYCQLLRNASGTVSIVPEVEVKLLGNTIYVYFNYFFKLEVLEIFIDETSHINVNAVSSLLEEMRIDVNIVSEIELYLKFNRIDTFH